MQVIKKLGDRVEKEHDQFLRDSQRLEDRSGMASEQSNNGIAAAVDFESLVGKANGATVKADTDIDNANWDDDPWGSILNSNPVSTSSRIKALMLTSLHQATTTIIVSHQPSKIVCSCVFIVSVTSN